MRNETVIQHITDSNEFINELAKVLFENHLKPFLEKKADENLEQKDKLYTRKETAKKLNIALSTLHEYTKSGKLTSKGIGSRVFYTHEDIQKALENK